jgi:ABC-2 type transport system ATP-binding protein
MSAAVEVERIEHRFGERVALAGVTFTVAPGRIFGLLGPNGGGKTTLFRILSTLITPSSGAARIFGRDVAREPNEVRPQIGVVFQSPSLDGKLRVGENLRHAGHLYNLSGANLEQRITELVAAFGLRDRIRDQVEDLSGGLKRRVEVAKSLLHSPKLLLLDEPSTGLDPGARLDLWEMVERLRKEKGVTILLTTHLMDEAERCDELAIIDRGEIKAIASPGTLRAEIGGEVILLSARNPEALALKIGERFQTPTTVLDGQVRVEKEHAHAFIAEILRAFPDEVDSVTFGRPTLEDVFLAKTGHRLYEG